MYADGLSFLDEERDAWRPFEALLALPDAQLEQPLAGAHGWTGRDLMAHLGVWIEWWLNIARELAVGPKSPAFDALSAIGREWQDRGDELNARYQAEWAALPIAEVRRRFSTLPGELRGYLTVVPEARWLKDSQHLKSLLANTTEHYADHEADLRAVLDRAAI
ncbi:MAG: maleylpyruvate isomerase N-terminal domain-containing protein [Candidatus Limnocylindrales bacterium]